MNIIHLSDYILAHSFTYLSIFRFTNISCTCKVFHQIYNDDKFDPYFFRTEVLCSNPGIVLSAMEKNVTTSCKSWLEILKVASLQSVEWLISETSDRATLKKPSQSRSAYVIRVEAGCKRFIRIGGHYFFKVGYCSFDSHNLDSKTGMIIARNWEQPRIHGIGPAPLRGFTLNSLDWKLSSLNGPVTVIFGGAESAYPFDESNALNFILQLTDHENIINKNNNSHCNTKKNKSRYVWLKGNALGTPPSPRRGCSATAISKGRQIVIIGGSRTSPCVNLNDIHILDMRGALIEEDIYNISLINNVHSFPKILNGMRWSKVVTSNCFSFLGRSSHSALRLPDTSEKNPDKEEILVYGGFQLGGQTTLWDTHSLEIDLSFNRNNGGSKCETEEKKEQKTSSSKADDNEYKETECEVSCSWSSINTTSSSTKVPGKRIGPGTFFCGRKMILIGGYDPTRWKDDDEEDSTVPVDILIFDPLPKPRWYSPISHGSTIPPSRCGAGLSLVGSILLMSGGYESTKKDVRAKLLNKVDSWRIKFGSS